MVSYENDWLYDCLVSYIKKIYIWKYDNKKILQYFQPVKSRNEQLWIIKT